MRYLAGLLVLLFLVAGCHSPQQYASPDSSAKAPEVKRVLVLTGADHPAHDWRRTAPVLADVLRQDTRLKVSVIENPDFLASPNLNDHDVVVLHFMKWEQPTPGPEARENLRRFVSSGGGMFVLHFACGAIYDWPEFANLAGRAWDPKLRAHDPKGVFRVNITATDHPITQGMKSFETNDELYTCLGGDRPVDLLATARSKVDAKDYPMAFSFDYGKGRVFHCALGHDINAILNPPAAELFRRGCAWSAGLDPVRP